MCEKPPCNTMGVLTWTHFYYQNDGTDLDYTYIKLFYDTNISDLDPLKLVESEIKLPKLAKSISHTTQISLSIHSWVPLQQITISASKALQCKLLCHPLNHSFSENCGMASALDICKANIDTQNDAVAVIDKAVAHMRQVVHSETETPLTTCPILHAQLVTCSITNTASS